MECEPGPRGAARRPPAVSPELGLALLMESSREAKGRGTGSWSRDSGLNHFGGPRSGVSREACEVEKRVPACHAVNGGVLESECERGVRGRTPVSHRGREYVQGSARGLECYSWGGWGSAWCECVSLCKCVRVSKMRV